VRRIFLGVLLVYLCIAVAGLFFLGTRLYTVKTRVESISEAQESLIMRLELRDTINKLHRMASGKEFSVSAVQRLKGELKMITAGCSGCHHSETALFYVTSIENEVLLFDRDISTRDFVRNPDKALRSLNHISPLVEESFVKARSLADERVKTAIKEIYGMRDAGMALIILGLFLFLFFSYISLSRVSTLESAVLEREIFLRDWAEKWQLTFDSISDMVFIIDSDCRILMMNKPAGALCGNDAVGKLIEDAAPELLGDVRCKLFKNASTKEISFSDKIYMFRSFNMGRNDGQDNNIVVLSDITEQKDMEIKLAQSEKMAALGQMIAGVAHELNNPLNSVNGFSQILLYGNYDDAVKQLARKIKVSTERLAKIVEDLLLFSKGLSTNKSIVDIKVLALEALNSVKESLKSGGVPIVAVVDVEEGLLVSIDAARMERVLLNLMANAIQAMHESGKGDLLEIKAWRTKTGVRMTFRDNGPGIPHNIQHRVFEPFFTTKKFKSGTGLGLSICYNLVKAHGGGIWVKSVEGEGTTFGIDLPQ
jgi:signal transduction histidine kinase